MADVRASPDGNVVVFRGAHAGRRGGRKQRHLPLGPALVLMIERLQEIAVISRDSLLTEGPVHPDFRLLDLCALALHCLQQAHEAGGNRKTEIALARPLTHEELASREAALDKKHALEAVAAQFLRQARRLRAQTGAGIYAKALLVAGSATGAAGLAQSLAADLIACEALRQTLAWPDTRREPRP